MRFGFKRWLALSLAALVAGCVPSQISKVSTARSFVTLEEVAKAFGVPTAVYRGPDHGDFGRMSATDYYFSTVEIDAIPAQKTFHTGFEIRMDFGQDAVRTKASFNDLRESIGIQKPLEYPTSLGDDAFYWESQVPPVTGGIDRMAGVLIGDRYLTISSHSLPQGVGGPVLSKEAFLALARLAVDRARAATLPIPQQG